ncbi:hypothetical protein [Magnetospira thiophila]
MTDARIAPPLSTTNGISARKNAMDQGGDGSVKLGMAVRARVIRVRRGGIV